MSRVKDCKNEDSIEQNSDYALTTIETQAKNADHSAQRDSKSALSANKANGQSASQIQK
jgi:hypothetical protein